MLQTIGKSIALMNIEQCWWNFTLSSCVTIGYVYCAFLCLSSALCHDFCFSFLPLSLSPPPWMNHDHASRLFCVLCSMVSLSLSLSCVYECKWFLLSECFSPSFSFLFSVYFFFFVICAGSVVAVGNLQQLKLV